LVLSCDLNQAKFSKLKKKNKIVAEVVSSFDVLSVYDYKNIWPVELVDSVHRKISSMPGFASSFSLFIPTYALFIAVF